MSVRAVPYTTSMWEPTAQMSSGDMAATSDNWAAESLGVSTKRHTRPQGGIGVTVGVFVTVGVAVGLVPVGVGVQVNVLVGVCVGGRVGVPTDATALGVVVAMRELSGVGMGLRVVEEEPGGVEGTAVAFATAVSEPTMNAMRRPGIASSIRSRLLCILRSFKLPRPSDCHHSTTPRWRLMQSNVSTFEPDT